MLPSTHRVARVQKALRYFERDIPLLNLRVKDLSAERQHLAREFAQTLVNRTRAELNRLIAEQPQSSSSIEEISCEPAD